MKPILKVEYLIDDDNMSDKEWENQEFREFTITQDMLIELVGSHVKLERDQTIDSSNFFITKI